MGSKKLEQNVEPPFDTPGSVLFGALRFSVMWHIEEFVIEFF
jgi:hypothetical protein